MKISNYLESTKGTAQQLKLLSRYTSLIYCMSQNGVSDPMPGNGYCLLEADWRLTITSDRPMNRYQLATGTWQIFWQKALMWKTLQVKFPNEVTSMYLLFQVSWIFRSLNLGVQKYSAPAQYSFVHRKGKSKQSICEELCMPRKGAVSRMSLAESCSKASCTTGGVHRAWPRGLARNVHNEWNKRARDKGVRYLVF